jgi:hypothetical protein
MEPTTIALAAITLLAATVNGALGYGFSSITVPVALFFLTNRVLNPALVPIEVVLNAYVLWVNRGSIQHVWRRTLPIVVALLPGVIVGTMLVSQVNSDWLKFITYVTLALIVGAMLQFGESAAVAQKKSTVAPYTIVDLPGPYHTADGNWSNSFTEKISNPNPVTGTVYVTGWHARPDGVQRSCLWAVNGGQNVAAAGLHGLIFANAVNSAGVVGGSQDGRPALRFLDGNVVLLPTTENNFGLVRGLNDPDSNGLFQVVGFQQSNTPTIVQYQGMLWTVRTDGSVLFTQSLMDVMGLSFEPCDVNNDGVMAGVTKTNGPFEALLVWFDDNNAFQIEYLPNPNPAVIRYWRDVQIDDTGNVVGYGAEPTANPSSYPRAVVWPINGQVVSLSSLNGGASTMGNGIATVNGVMQVVGSAFSNNGWYAYLYTPSKLSDLNRLSKGPQAWQLFDGGGINRAGWICGSGRAGSGRTAQQHGCVLIPNAQ